MTTGSRRRVKTTCNILQWIYLPTTTQGPIIQIEDSLTESRISSAAPERESKIRSIQFWHK